MAGRNVLRVIMTADGAPMVRSFREVAAASDETTATIEDNSVKQSASFDHAKEGAGRLRDSVGMLAGTVGLAGLAFGVKDVIEAGEQWQEQQAQLVNALKNTHQYSTQTANSLRTASESLSTHGGFAGPQEISAITAFIRENQSASNAVKDSRAMTDLARGANLGYGQSLALIQRGLDGQSRGLQKYIGIIQPVKTAEFNLAQQHGMTTLQLTALSKAYGKLGPLQLQHEEILNHLTPKQLQHAQLLDKQATATQMLDLIQQKYGNSTTTFSRTTSGAISNLKNHFDLLGESIGRKVLPAITAIIEYMSKHVTTILIVTGVVTALGIAYGIVTAAVAIWGAAAAVAAAANVIVAGSVGVLAGAFEAMGVSAAIAWIAATGGLILLVAAVAAAVYFIVTHFHQVKRIVMDVVDWIAGHWRGLVLILTGPIGLAIIFIVDHFHKITKVASQVFGALLPIVTWPFKEAWKIISGIFNAIMGAMKHLLGPLGSIVHSVGGFLAHPFGLHTGGIVPHMATGGILGGWGGGDTVPTMLEPGEGVLRKESVQSIGSQQFNAINATGSIAGMGGGPGAEIYVAQPLKVYLGQRVVAEQTNHFIARKSSLSGNYVSG